MADWEAVDLDTITTNFQNQHLYTNGLHSRESSESSETPAHDLHYYANSNTPNIYTPTGLDGTSSLTSDDSSQREVILTHGRQLLEESRTDGGFDNFGLENGDSNKLEVASLKVPVIPAKSWSGGTAKEKAAKSPFTMSSSAADTIPEEEFTIPKDGNISTFSVNQLANFLKCLKIDDRVVTHLHRKSVDGKRFAKLSDTELENLSISNPVVEFFRERSRVKKGKVKGPFLL